MFVAPNKPIQPLTREASAGYSLNQFARRLAFRPRRLGDCREQAFRSRDVFLARRGTLRRAECLTRN